MAKLNLFELDAKGIVPLIGELEENFLERGNFIFEVSKKISDNNLARYIVSFNNPCRFAGFSDRFMFRKMALWHIKRNYGMDLSWVRILSRKISLYPSELFILGECHTARIENEMDILVPVISLAVPLFAVVIHEFVHAARFVYIIDPSCDIVFEEEVADEIYLKRFFINNDRTKFFLKIRKKLEIYFGRKHGYVFIRLSPKEIAEHVFSTQSSHGNPVKYLQNMAKTELRYRIMCQKLGL